MTRYFIPISQEALVQKVETATGDEYYPSESPRIKQDLKVVFDCENFEKAPFGNHDSTNKILGVHTLENGFTFWGMYGGGDWEYPVYFIIYWDGKSLRAYVPTNGNNWNTDTKQAYGNDEEADTNNIRKRFYSDRDPEDIPDYLGVEDCPHADGDKMLEEIVQHIIPRPEAKVKAKVVGKAVELKKALKQVSDEELLAECRRRLRK